jgi:phage terminase small subunit
MKLTAKQEKFCQSIASGMNQTEAYRAAYSTKNMLDKTIWERASIVAQTDKVKARIRNLQAELAAQQLWSRAESARVLREITNSDTARNSDKINAAKVLNKMHGLNRPESHEDKPEPVEVQMVLIDAS